MRQTITPAPRLRFFTRLRAPNLTALLSRGLAPGATISLRLRWPLALLAVAAVAHLLMPDPVWSTVVLLLLLLHVGAWGWLRLAARGLSFARTRAGTLLVVGDTLEEEFVVANASSAPLAWLEVRDSSTLPGYAPGRVVGVGPSSRQRWRTTALCTQRGRFRLGPHTLVTGDPLSLFTLTFAAGAAEEVVIYPRVVRVPALPLPRGDLGGETRARRPLFGVQPAANVRGWLPSDDLRFVHWPSTARRGALMVRELELEPAGDLWVLLDSCAAAALPVAPSTPPAPPLPPNTFEFAVTVAAGAAAALLEGATGRGVGLLAADGDPPALLCLPPQRRRAHLWSYLTALAPLAASPLRLASLLQQAPALLPSRSSLMVITADLADAAQTERWTAQLVGLRERGFFASALLLTTPATEHAAAGVQALLASYRVEARILPADAWLPAALTQRRRRTIVRSSPLGRAVAVEVEEEVG